MHDRVNSFEERVDDIERREASKFQSPSEAKTIIPAKSAIFVSRSRGGKDNKRHKSTAVARSSFIADAAEAVSMRA